ncbi:MAG TPA: SIMPL domain-containing protein [Casimicrobiaceae bacterium]|nr:SIMPL domain-containing protein [Casimicrobiaceae bacterium]
MKWLLAVLLTFSCGLAGAAEAPPPTPVVTLSASATASVPNDRMQASLRVEADNPDPARAAAEVNAKMAKALARAKATQGVEAQTSGYSSYQMTDKNGQPNRWHVTQSLTLESSDFATMASLLTRLQADDGMLLSSMGFSVSPAARQKAEDALTQQAIKGWQARAQNAAKGFGFDAWRAGHVSIGTGEPPIRPQPMLRMQAASAMSAPPVNVEGGDTDVTVTVTGEAILERK